MARRVARWRDVLTVREVAARLRISTATVHAMCRRGELGHYRMSHAIRVPENALRKYLAFAEQAPRESGSRLRPKM